TIKNISEIYVEFITNNIDIHTDEELSDEDYDVNEGSNTINSFEDNHQK
ncbi:6322_t:CDS:1, partial [Racocetra fulgida]